MEFKKTDLSVELIKHTGDASGYFDPVRLLADGMGFLAKSPKLVGGKFQEFILYAFDLKTHKIIWSHAFEDIGIKNYRDIKYVNGKLYFLRGNGELHIFEKET